MMNNVRLFFAVVSLVTLSVTAHGQSLSGVWTTVPTVGPAVEYDGASAVVNGKMYVINGSPRIDVYEASTNTWSALTPTGTFTPRIGMTASAVNDKIYVIGGRALDNVQDFLSTVEVFDPGTNSWSTPTTTGSFKARGYHTADVLNGKIYIFGGFNNSAEGLPSVQIFDPASNTWSTPNTTGTFTQRYRLESDVIDGKIYVLGGDALPSGKNAVSTLEVFDPATLAWTTPNTTGTFTPRDGFGCCAINGLLYAAEGSETVSQSANDVNILEVFDPKTDTWSTPKTLGTALTRERPNAAVIGGKMYLFGGSSFAPTNVLEEFDPASLTWSEPPPPPGEFIGRQGPTANVVGNRVYVIGGLGPDSAHYIQILDATTHTWSTPSTSGTFTPRCEHASVIVGGKIYVIGGFANASLITGPAMLASTIDVFDPQNNTWTPLTTNGTFTPRALLGATSWHNKIFVFGGTTNFSSSMDTFQVFDPATNAWSTPVTSGIPTARFGLTASTVGDQLYFIGGSSDPTSTLDILETFDPLKNTWDQPDYSGTFIGRTQFAADVQNNAIFTFGGINWEAGVGNAEPNVEAFDVPSSTWIEVSTSGDYSPNYSIAAAAVGNQFFTVGGFGTNITQVLTLGTNAVAPVAASGAYTLLPNPTPGPLTLPANQGFQRISITNSIGESVMQLDGIQCQRTALDLSTLPSGIYFVRLETENGISTQKVVRE